MRQRSFTDRQMPIRDDRRQSCFENRIESRRSSNRHLSHRQKNRGIDDGLVDLVNTYGEPTFIGDGRVIVRLAPDLLEQLQKVYLVRDVSSGQVITAGHRFKRVKG
ncbi:MAG TPA: hypothetical protein PLZ57_07375 [Pseudobdellovibrionaceae bacterium]|nr:hypothetical protein [Pseudobdellovibrionaceae bacterium]